MLKKIAALGVAAGSLAGVRRLLKSGTPSGRRVRAVRDRSGVWVRRLANQSQRARYRLSGAHPALDVDDRTLADRIRSTIGPLEKRLGVPRVHVMVENRKAVLHGEVRSHSDVQALESAVSAVSGVDEVESRLRVGLLPGEDRATARATKAGTVGTPS